MKFWSFKVLPYLLLAIALSCCSTSGSRVLYSLIATEDSSDLKQHLEVFPVEHIVTGKSCAGNLPYGLGRPPELTEAIQNTIKNGPTTTDALYNGEAEYTYAFYVFFDRQCYSVTATPVKLK